MSEEDSRYVTVADLGSVLPPPTLPWLDLELTERCDNDCRHCCVDLPLDDASARAREMSADRVIELLDEAAGLGLRTLRVSGGEPLLRDDFEEIYLYARRLGVSVILCTNARRITPRLARLFDKTPPLRPVEITVYGMTEASYEAMTRRSGSYAEFRRGIDLLVEASVPMRLSGAFRAPFLEEMRSLQSWAAESPTVVGTPDNVMFYDLRRRRDSPARSRSIAQLRADPDEVLRAAALVVGHEAVTVDFCRKFVRPAGDKIFACGIGCRPCIDAYGDLQPCTSLRDPSLTYDLSSGSLKDAVTKYFPRMRETRTQNPSYLDRCARCFLMGLCQQCPARSYSEHGVLDRPVEYQCEVAQAQARRLGLLADGERPWEINDWKERIECLTE